MSSLECERWKVSRSGWDRAQRNVVKIFGILRASSVSRRLPARYLATRDRDDASRREFAAGMELQLPALSLLLLGRATGCAVLHRARARAILRGYGSARSERRSCDNSTAIDQRTDDR